MSKSETTGDCGQEGMNRESSSIAGGRKAGSEAEDAGRLIDWEVGR